MKKYRLWTEEEKEELYKLYMIECLPPLEISTILNRSKAGILKQITINNWKHNKEQEKKCRSISNTGDKNGMYGKRGWCKGLTKKTCLKMIERSKKLSKIKKEMYNNGSIKKLYGKDNPMWKKIPWNKGLTKFDDQRIMNNSIKNSMTQKQHWESLPEKEKEKRRKKWALQGLKCKKKETKIEIEIKNYLSYLKINFIQQYNVDKFICDFYLPDYNLIIECQGDYWHGNPNKYFKYSMLNKTQKNNINRDKRKKQKLKEANIDSLFIWENDILNNFSYVKEIINEKIKIRATRTI